MDQNTILIIIMLCVNVLTSLFNSSLVTLQLFLKGIKKSRCCNSEVEMKEKLSTDNMVDLKKNEEFDVIVQRIRKSMTETQK